MRASSQGQASAHARDFLRALSVMDQHLDAARRALDRGDRGEASHRGLADASWALGKAATELRYAAKGRGVSWDALLAAEQRARDFEARLRAECAPASRAVTP